MIQEKKVSGIRVHNYDLFSVYFQNRIDSDDESDTMTVQRVTNFVSTNTKRHSIAVPIDSFLYNSLNSDTQIQNFLSSVMQVAADRQQKYGIDSKDWEKNKFEPNRSISKLLESEHLK